MRGACELLTEACGLLRQGNCELTLTRNDTSIQDDGLTICGGMLSADSSSFLGQLTQILRKELGAVKSASEGAVISEKQKSRKSIARFSNRKPALLADVVSRSKPVGPRAADAAQARVADAAKDRGPGTVNRSPLP
jgi:hypothetical protein